MRLCPSFSTKYSLVILFYASFLLYCTLNISIYKDKGSRFPLRILFVKILKDSVSLKNNLRNFFYLLFMKLNAIRCSGSKRNDDRSRVWAGQGEELGTSIPGTTPQVENRRHVPCMSRSGRGTRHLSTRHLKKSK